MTTFHDRFPYNPQWQIDTLFTTLQHGSASVSADITNKIISVLDASKFSFTLSLVSV